MLMILWVVVIGLVLWVFVIIVICIDVVYFVACFDFDGGWDLYVLVFS